MPGAAQRVIAEIHRHHYRELLAPLIRMLGSFEQAEDVVQDSFAQALRKWSETGIPDEPLAWLRRVAKNRAIDVYRRRSTWQAKQAMLGAQAETDATHEMLVDDDGLGDDSLRLIFTCCHPSLAPESRVALTLRTVCGLTTDQVARSFLVKPTTLQQRIVRAKRKIDQAKIPYVIPTHEQLGARLESVLKTIYLVFNEGYGATDGDALIRRELCDEAIRLARLLDDLMPRRGEVQGLLAMMLLHHSRRHARTDADGELITLEDQDRSRWDRALIDEALPLVDEALRQDRVSTYAIEAAIAALHARAPQPQVTDWPQIAALYAVLERRSLGNPVVALNAAVAVAMAGQLDHGLRRLDALDQDGSLAGYHLLPAARGDLLRRRGDHAGARAAYDQALELVQNPVERRFLARRRDQLGAAEK